MPRSQTAPGETTQAIVGRPYLVVVAISLGALLAPLNSTMLAVALPGLRDDFDVSAAAVGWLVSGYLVAMAVVQPVGGRLGDELGRPRVYRIALVAFLGASLAAAAAPTFSALVAFRTVQAITGAVLIPNGMGMLRAAVPPEHFGRYAGFNGAIIGGSAATGPLLGGAILAIGPWPLLFLANIPVVLAALILSRALPANPPATTVRTGTGWAGLALFALLLVALTALLNQLRSGETPWSLLLATASLAAAFAWSQRRTRSPAAAWPLFRNRSFVGASSHILLMNLAMYTTLLAIPFFVKDIQGHDAAVAGALISGMAVLQAISAPVVGRLSDAVGRRLPALAGSCLAVLAAAALVLLLDTETPVVAIAIPVALLGLGVGLGFVAASAAAVEAVPVAFAGSAAGTQSMMRYVGSIIGSGVLAGLLTTGEASAAGLGTFRVLFAFILLAALLSIAAAAAIRPRTAVHEPTEAIHPTAVPVVR
jgi:EmrB/QacA subfamily drug resistance transporter